MRHLKLIKDNIKATFYIIAIKRHCCRIICPHNHGLQSDIKTNWSNTTLKAVHIYDVTVKLFPILSSHNKLGKKRIWKNNILHNSSFYNMNKIFTFINTCSPLNLHPHNVQLMKEMLIAWAKCNFWIMKAFQKLN